MKTQEAKAITPNHGGETRQGQRSHKDHLGHAWLSERVVTGLAGMRVLFCLRKEKTLWFSYQVFWGLIHSLGSKGDCGILGHEGASSLNLSLTKRGIKCRSSFITELCLPASLIILPGFPDEPEV